MTILVDSNVILDIATDDPDWGIWSSTKLAELAETSRLAINPIIYAEVSIRYSRIEELEDALPSSVFSRQPLPWEAAFLAGKAFLQYKERGGDRHSPLPDLYIGAHAAVAGFTLLTRDSGRYRTYFPTIEIVSP